MCCGGQCVVQTFSDDHCGGCGKACPEGKGCCESTPFAPATDTCVDVRHNEKHCGTCLAACGLSDVCCDGKCLPAAQASAECKAL
jgi:hypothetical protein